MVTDFSRKGYMHAIEGIIAAMIVAFYLTSLLSTPPTTDWTQVHVSKRSEDVLSTLDNTDILEDAIERNDDASIRAMLNSMDSSLGYTIRTRDHPQAHLDVGVLAKNSETYPFTTTPGNDGAGGGGGGGSPVPNVYRVQTQHDWNQGLFDGASADRNDNSGTLGIGYLNGSGSDLRVDGFEDNDIGEYYGDTSEFAVASGAARTGSYGLNFTRAGTSGYREIFSNPGDGLPNYVSKGDTITFWTRSSTTDGGTTAQAEIIFGKDTDTGQDQYYNAWVNFDEGNFAIVKNNETMSPAPQVTDTSAFTYTSNTWYKVEVNWYQNDTIIATLYDDTGTELSTISYTDESGDINGNGIGFRGYSDGPTVHYDDYRVQTNDLLGYWRLDKTSGSVTDYSGNGFHAPASNIDSGTTRGVPGVFSTNAFDFDGSTSIGVDVSSSSTLNPTNALTLSTWVKVENDLSGTHTWVAKGAAWCGTSCSSEYGPYYMGQSNDDVWFGLYPPATSDREAVIANDVLSQDTWHHVVATWDGSNASIFVDGQHISSSNIGITLKDANTLRIGDSLYTREFNGDLDEVRIYNRRLTDSEIRQLYFHGTDTVFDGNYTSETVDTADSGTTWNELQVDATLPSGGGGGGSGPEVDTFDDGDISEYTYQTSHFTVQNGVAVSGEALASDTTSGGLRIYNDTALPNAVSQGDSFSLYLRSNSTDPGDNLKQRPMFGFQDIDNYYYVQIEWDADPIQWAISVRESGTRYPLAQNTASLSADTWYRVEVDWETDGTITARLYDASTGNQIDTLSGVDNNYTSGSTGFDIDDRTGDVLYFDEWTLGTGGSSGDVNANAVFQALDGSGTVVDERVFTLQDGLQNYTLGASSEDARWIINGSSSTATQTWEVDDTALFYETPSGSGGGGGGGAGLPSSENGYRNGNLNQESGFGNIPFVLSDTAFDGEYKYNTVNFDFNNNGNYDDTAEGPYRIGDIFPCNDPSCSGEEYEVGGMNTTLTLYEAGLTKQLAERLENSLLQRREITFDFTTVNPDTSSIQHFDAVIAPWNLTALQNHQATLANFIAENKLVFIITNDVPRDVSSSYLGGLGFGFEEEHRVNGGGPRTNLLYSIHGSGNESYELSNYYIQSPLQVADLVDQGSYEEGTVTIRRQPIDVRVYPDDTVTLGSESHAIRHEVGDRMYLEGNDYLLHAVDPLQFMPVGTQRFDSFDTMRVTGDYYATRMEHYRYNTSEYDEEQNTTTTYNRDDPLSSWGDVVDSPCDPSTGPYRTGTFNTGGGTPFLMINFDLRGLQGDPCNDYFEYVYFDIDGNGEFDDAREGQYELGDTIELDGRTYTVKPFPTGNGTRLSAHGPRILGEVPISDGAVAGNGKVALMNRSTLGDDDIGLIKSVLLSETDQEFWFTAPQSTGDKSFSQTYIASTGEEHPEHFTLHTVWWFQ